MDKDAYLKFLKSAVQAEAKGFSERLGEAARSQGTCVFLGRSQQWLNRKLADLGLYPPAEPKPLTVDPPDRILVRDPRQGPDPTDNRFLNAYAFLDTRSPYLWPRYAVLHPGRALRSPFLEDEIYPVRPFQFPAFQKRSYWPEDELELLPTEIHNVFVAGGHLFLNWNGGEPDLDLQKTLGYGLPPGLRPFKSSYTAYPMDPQTETVRGFYKYQYQPPFNTQGYRTSAPGFQTRPGTAYWPPEVPFVVPYLLKPLTVLEDGRTEGCYATLTSGEFTDMFSGRTLTWYSVTYHAHWPDEFPEYLYGKAEARRIVDMTWCNYPKLWYETYILGELPEEPNYFHGHKLTLENMPSFALPSALLGTGPKPAQELFSFIVNPVPRVENPFTGEVFLEDDWFNLRPFVENKTLYWYEPNGDGTLREVTGDWERFPYKNLQGRRQILRSG